MQLPTLPFLRPFPLPFPPSSCAGNGSPKSLSLFQQFCCAPFSSAWLDQAQLGSCQLNSFYLVWTRGRPCQSFPHSSLYARAVGSALLLIHIFASVLSVLCPVAAFQRKLGEDLGWCLGAGPQWVMPTPSCCREGRHFASNFFASNFSSQNHIPQQ